MIEPGNLSNLMYVTLAPYIQKATALIDTPRKVGGNMFRHQMATMSILVDYKYDDPVLLKASLVHDLLEDKESGGTHGLELVDSDGPAVLGIVRELTIVYSSDKLENGAKENEKADQIKQIMEHGSEYARLIKLADRISNITDISTDTQSDKWIGKYIEQTKNCILPYAKDIQMDMYIELSDAIARKEKMISMFYGFKKLFEQFFQPINK